MFKVWRWCLAWGCMFQSLFKVPMFVLCLTYCRCASWVRCFICFQVGFQLLLGSNFVNKMCHFLTEWVFTKLLSGTLCKIEITCFSFSRWFQCLVKFATLWQGTFFSMFFVATTLQWFVSVCWLCMGLFVLWPCTVPKQHDISQEIGPFGKSVQTKYCVLNEAGWQNIT